MVCARLHRHRTVRVFAAVLSHLAQKRRPLRFARQYQGENAYLWQDCTLFLFVGRSSEFHCHRRNATAVGRHEERAWPRFPRFSYSFCRFFPTCSGVVQLSCVVKKVVRSGSGVVVHFTRGKQQQLVLVGRRKQRFLVFDVFVWNFRRSCRVVV
jgi:hypothetical protein